MGLLHLAVLGPPEVLHDGSRLAFPLRKAQALLLYLAVEGGMHSRSKLAALLWPDSEPQVARKALRNALALLRHLLASPAASPAQHSHLLGEGELLGLDPQTPRELDLDVVQRAALVTSVQHALALVRGPFLDGFWLDEDAPFDEWVRQQQQQWQVRLQVLCERLSSWQEASGELEQARTTLTRWLALDPLAEEAYRRLMRVHLAQGDPVAALRVYATCRERLAQELRVKPSADTVTLAERIRASAVSHRKTQPARFSPATVQNRSLAEFESPLMGRQAPFSKLVRCFQQACEGQPQAVLLIGEAGIGKTRLAQDWGAWAVAHGALVLTGQAFEMGGRLPYQPLVEALRPRLEAENAPEDLLEDLWLAELSRILPELRVRYPDLEAPTVDELTARLRLFEAMARLMDALARSEPLVLLLDDLQWADEASLDLLRYLSRHWIKQSSNVLLLGTMRSEALELNTHLSTQLVDLGRELPLTQVMLQPLSREETVHLVQAIARETSSSELETKLSTLGDFLYTQTDGHPLYLLETLKLLRDRQWLVPRVDRDGAFQLELGVELSTIIGQEQPGGTLLPPPVRSLILARLAQLSTTARQLVQASAVLGAAATAQHLWQVAEVEMQTGLEALEEATRSGILSEEETEGGRQDTYRFSHDLIRDVVYTELGTARRQVLHKRALVRLEHEGVRASALAYHARASGETEAAYSYSVQAGMEAVAVFAVADAIGFYEQARALLHEDQRLRTRLSAAEVERLYIHLGQAYSFQNDREKAQEAYEELLAYAQQQHQFTLASMTLNRLAILALQQSSDKPQVDSLLEQALRVAQTNHDKKALAETEWNLAQITIFGWDDPKGAQPHGEQALSLARESLDQELEARSLFLLGWIHVREGNFEEGARYVEASLALYALLSTEPTASRELQLPSFAIGTPLTQSLTNQATEAMCWATLAIAQLHGQVRGSIRSGSRALALSKEIKNVWVQVTSTICLTHGLLESGAYEEALMLMQHTIALARNLPSLQILLSFLHALGSTYYALQQWEEAHRSLEEAVAVGETLDLGYLRVPALSLMCMYCAESEEWEQAYHYALKAIIVRKSSDLVLNPLDYYSHYETEALLRGGDERQAREEVQRLEEHLGPYLRFRIPYLRSLAALAACEGHGEQASGHLREAYTIATDLGLPGEQWQIQAALGMLYEADDDPAQARTSFREAARIIQELAEGIQDETLCSRFLAGPQIQSVMQHI